MEKDKFYVIENNIVTNIIVCYEDYAVKHKLKRFPIVTDLGVVQMGWTYLPAEDTFLIPPRDILSEWEAVREVRDSLLRESDLYVMPDRWATYNQDEQNAWKVYRQALRDLTASAIDPKEIVWPTKPWVESMEYIKPSEPEIV